jgi:hypothetical protein
LIFGAELKFIGNDKAKITVGAVAATGLGLFHNCACGIFMVEIESHLLRFVKGHFVTVFVGPKK